MTKHIPYGRIAKAANCSRATVARLVKTGKLVAGPKQGRQLTVETENVNAAVVIIKTTSPRSGYAKTERKSKGSDSLKVLASWIKVPEEKRAILLELAEKYNLTDLKTLKDL